jgi:alpha-glucosidase
VTYYGADLAGAQLPFNFQLIRAPWEASRLARLIDQYERALPEGAWPNWVLGNHDQHRIASRVGRAQARVAAMLLLTLRGTPTLYYGDEIGMVDVAIPPEDAQDPVERNIPGLGLGRDPERTPMQWSAEANAGFSRARPWLPVAPDHGEVNVAAQSDDSRSMLSLYRKLIALRRGEPALEVGRFELMKTEGDLLAYVRRGRDGESAFLVALNLGDKPQRLSGTGPGMLVLTTYLDRTDEPLRETIELRPNEGAVVRLPTPKSGSR